LHGYLEKYIVHIIQDIIPELFREFKHKDKNACITTVTVSSGDPGTQSGLAATYKDTDINSQNALLEGIPQGERYTKLLMRR